MVRVSWNFAIFIGVSLILFSFIEKKYMVFALVSVVIIISGAIYITFRWLLVILKNNRMLYRSRLLSKEFSGNDNFTLWDNMNIDFNTRNNVAKNIAGSSINEIHIASFDESGNIYSKYGQFFPSDIVNISQS